MPSNELATFYKRVIALRQQFLPAAFNPLGKYSATELDSTRAFVALTHAELESFIEERALTVAERAVNRWIQHRKSGAVIFTLMTMCYTGWADLHEELRPQNATIPNQLMAEPRLSDALKQFQKIIGDNNGIREKNLKAMLVPLSIRLEGDIGKTWLNTMDSFGATRGLVVHQSSTSTKAKQPPDPQSIWDSVIKGIMPGIVRLDRLLIELR